MSGVHYSNGTIGNFICDSSSTQTFMDNVATAFTTCNWTIIGRIPGPSGTSGYTFRSLITPKLQQCHVKVYWTGATVPLAGFPIVQFGIYDITETINFTCGSIWIRPQKKNRIICGPYQFFCFFDSSISPAPDVPGFGGNDASGGIPVTESIGLALWGLGGENSFRRTLLPSNHSSDFGFYIHEMTKTTFLDPATIPPTLLTLRGSELLNPVPFSSGRYAVTAPQMVLGTTSDPIVVSLWDAIMVSQFFNTAVGTIADYHQWEAFSIQCSSSTTTGCLFLSSHSYASSGVGSYSH